MMEEARCNAEEEGMSPSQHGVPRINSSDSTGFRFDKTSSPVKVDVTLSRGKIFLATNDVFPRNWCYYLRGQLRQIGKYPTVCCSFGTESADERSMNHVVM